MGSFALIRNCFDDDPMSSRLSDYDYDLPPGFIAQRPLPRRDASRLMVLHRDSETIEHRAFSEVTRFTQPGDLFVLNDTRVVPARKFSDDGRIEFLFLEKLGAGRWKCLVKPGRKMRLGARTMIGQTEARVSEVTATGERIIELERDIDVYAGGIVPLPPYLGRLSDAEDEARYQTIFAQHPGAVAAPTAGLHFTPEILCEIPHAFVTLHVGLGTFQPVQVEDLKEHHMHAERFEISAATAHKVNEAQRVIAVGTTSTRVLESARTAGREATARSGWTDLFIYPPYEFQAVDVMLTNFHLPRSTLLMLVSALAGREFILRAYKEAIREKYRFFSYGDCMLIL